MLKCRAESPHQNLSSPLSVISELRIKWVRLNKFQRRNLSLTLMSRGRDMLTHLQDFLSELNNIVGWNEAYIKPCLATEYTSRAFWSSIKMHWDGKKCKEPIQVPSKWSGWIFPNSKIFISFVENRVKGSSNISLAILFSTNRTKLLCLLAGD